MSDPHGDDRLALEYLSPHDETRVRNALELTRGHQAQIPPQQFELLEQTLFTLCAWQMPTHALLATIGLYLAESLVFSAQELQSLLDRTGYKLIQALEPLVRPTAKASDPDDLKRAYRSDRLRELYQAAYEDIEAVLLALATHMARMQTLRTLDRQSARMLAEDNESIILPLAEMLGLWSLRRQLGDMSLEYLNPRKVWLKITEKQEQNYRQHTQCHSEIKRVLDQDMSDLGITGCVRLHTSPASSVYRRMLRGEPLDRLASKAKIDVIVDTDDECYRVLGLIHRRYSPQAGRTLVGSNFRDLICSPKFNGYRALITTVTVDRQEKKEAKTHTLVEFRVYTKAMEETNLMGVVAAQYWAKPPVEIRNAWWTHAETRRHIRKPFRNDADSVIYVFSPVGEVYILPQGSTTLDYIYCVHSEIVQYCQSIWVNGRPADHRRKLRSGDLVSIETSARSRGTEEIALQPSEDWLDTVKTSTAKSHIRRALRQQGAARHRGREIIDNLLEIEQNAYNLEIPKETTDQFLRETAHRLNYETVAALYNAITAPKRLHQAKRPSPDQIVARLIAYQLAEHIVYADGKPLRTPKHRIKFARHRHNKQPCRVVPGSEIVGRLEQPGKRHERLTVYRRDCPNAPAEGRAIPLAWLGDRRTGTPVRVNVQAVDRARLLGEVLQEVYDLYDQGLYLLHVQADVQRDRSAKVQMQIDAKDYRSVDLLSQRLDQLREHGVIDVGQVNVLDPLEKMLLADRGSPSNPYMPGQPVDDPRTFKGREAELNKIVNWLRGDQNAIVLSGTHRVGKTSLLRYLYHHVAPQYGFAPVLVDLQGLNQHNETAFWLDAATEIDRAIARLYGSARPRGLGKMRQRIEQDCYDGFCQRLQAVKPAMRDQKLLVMVDELNAIDELWDRRNALSFVSHLKSLIQDEREVAFVLCVQETVYREAHLLGREVLSNPLVQMGPPLRLDYLDPYAARKLIREPMTQMLRYDDCTVDRIVHMTAGHPYYLQSLLHRIVGTVAPNDESASISVTADHIEAIIPELLDDGTYLFNDLLREPQGGRSRAILSALAHAKRDCETGATVQEIRSTLNQRNISIPVSQLSRLLEFMCSVGTIKCCQESGQAAYYVRVPLFDRWLVENQPLG